jgi:hypothetical protein
VRAENSGPVLSLASCAVQAARIGFECAAAPGIGLATTLDNNALVKKRPPTAADLN